MTDCCWLFVVCKQDVYNDIHGAQALGMMGILVKTGGCKHGRSGSCERLLVSNNY